MTRMMIVHEVEDGDRWAKAWKAGPGSRQELVRQAGVTSAQTFLDPQNPNLRGLLIDANDVAKFQAFLQSGEAVTAMGEDGVKVDTIRMLTDFTP